MVRFFEKFRQMELFAVSFKKDETGKKGRRSETVRRTVRLAISGVMAALSFVLIFLGVSLGVMDLSALIIASMGVVFCIIEMGGSYPYLVWLVTSVLTFILLPDKLVFFEYFLFAGIYPIIKFRAALCRPIVCWTVKLLTFNMALALCAFISVYVLGLPSDVGFEIGWFLWIAGNIFFVLYDMCLSSVSAFYILRLRRVIGADRI